MTEQERDELIEATEESIRSFQASIVQLTAVTNDPDMAMIHQNTGAAIEQARMICSQLEATLVQLRAHTLE